MSNNTVSPTNDGAKSIPPDSRLRHERPPVTRREPEYDMGRDEMDEQRAWEARRR